MTVAAQFSVDVLFSRNVHANLCDSLGRLAQQPGNSFDLTTGTTNNNDSRDYRLTVSGLCSRTHQFSLNSLRDIFEPRQIHGNAFSSGLRTWTGCSLGEVLEYVGSSGQATELFLMGARTSGSDNPYEHSAVLIPLDLALEDKVLLAWSMDGKSLAGTTHDRGTYQGPIDAIIATEVDTHRIASLSRIVLTTL